MAELDKTFLIVLGDENNRRHQAMIKNIHDMGEVRKILDNVFVLEAHDKNDYEDVRNKVAGKDFGYCLVISLSGLKAAWNLTPDDSKYLRSFFSSEP